MKKYTKILFLFLTSFVASFSLSFQVKGDAFTKKEFLIKRAKIKDVANRDSILKLLPIAKDPANRIKLINDVILINGELPPKEAFYYDNKILGITRKIKDKVSEAVIMSELGYSISQNGNYKGGLHYKNLNGINSSFYYANKSYKSSQNLFYIRKLYPAELLASLYNKLDADSTLKHLKIFFSIRDGVYNMDKVTRDQLLAFLNNQRLRSIKQSQVDYKVKMQTYLLAFFLFAILIVAFLLWQVNRKKQKAFELQKEQTDIQKTAADEAFNKLKDTQSQLIQSEKMASLGELTAGIAHEIQNPLNFVNNFSDVNIELLEEMNEELDKGNLVEVKQIAKDILENEYKINYHGRRADGIVKGMLQHSRNSSSIKEPTDINKLADEYLRLSYHGLRAKDKSFNAELETHFSINLPKAHVIPQDIGRVFLNLFTNAFYATHQKQKVSGQEYKPTVSVTTLQKDNFVEIIVEDNGMGIPDSIKDKIMQPFFTTKPTGEGTGLGLSLSYDIVVKSHGGSISIDSKENEYTIFAIRLPLE